MQRTEAGSTTGHRDVTEIDIKPATAEAARHLTDRIKVALEGTWILIQEAYHSRAWDALGYGSWDEYCTREFGTSRLRLPREERQEVVVSLRESGLSERSIASATGLGRGTVQRELSGGPNGPPAQGDSEPPRVTGADGRSYPSRSNGWHQRPEPEPPDEPEEHAEVEVWFPWETDLQQRLEAGETVIVSMRGEGHPNLIRWAKSEGLFVRIDRNSDWGNPFEMPGDGNREAVIASYAAHYLPHKPSLLTRIGELRGKALGCWCAPEPCHGDVLKARAG